MSTATARSRDVGAPRRRRDAAPSLRTGRRRLLVDAFLRLRVADGFSHARSLAFMTSLVLVQGLIALVGFASLLGKTVSAL